MAYLLAFLSCGNANSTLAVNVYMLINSIQPIAAIIGVVVLAFLIGFYFTAASRLLRSVTGTTPEEAIEELAYLTLTGNFGVFIIFACPVWKIMGWRLVKFRTRKRFVYYELVLYFLKLICQLHGMIRQMLITE